MSGAGRGGSAVNAAQSGAHRRQRVVGALVGSVVGDALGAPFEFGPAGEFTRAFPDRCYGTVTEMAGGGSCGWGPGEWTDDTQLALHVALSLLDRGGVDEADLWERFRAWLAAGPRDVGVQTGAVLASGGGWEHAARRYFQAGNRAAGNGSLMRAVPAAICFARAPLEDSVSAARRISALTHGDPAAGEGCGIYHRLIAAALAGADPLGVLPDALAAVAAEHRGVWQTALATTWTPQQAGMSNGAVWPALGTAVWALRAGWDFPEAMRQVIDLGGDTDTLACVTGGLLGAVQGIEAIPSRWTTPLNGLIPGYDGPALDLPALQNLALRLDGQPASEDIWPCDTRRGIDPVEVAPGLWLTDLAGAARAPAEAMVISLCRTFGRIGHGLRRQVYLTDDEHNLDPLSVLRDVVATIDAVRAEGRPVVVHCYGGASRTGLVLRAWLTRAHGLTAEQATREAQRIWPPTAGWNTQFDQALEDFTVKADPDADRQASQR